MRALRFGLAIAAISLSAPAMAASLVNNGGFETGNFSGWTNFGDQSFTGVASSGAFEGNNYAFFGTIGSTSGIFQTLATTIGSVYSYSFALANDGGNPNSFVAAIGGNTVLSLSNAPSSRFTVYSGTFTATSTATDLRFTARQDPAFFSLDAVSVNTVSAPVPEPATWAMMIGGIGMVGGTMRYRRRKTTVTFA